MLNDARVKEVSVECERLTYRMPLKFGAQRIADAVYSVCTVSLEDGRGRRAMGRGGLLMGTQWAWPSTRIPLERRTQRLLDLQEQFGRRLTKAEAGHPLDIAHAMKPALADLRQQSDRAAGAGEAMPVLAAIMAASPWDAAVHDAYGRLHGACAYDTLHKDFMRRDLSAYMGAGFKGKYPRDFLRPRRLPRIPIMHLLGGFDKLTADEVTDEDPRDGHPVSLDQYVRRDGIYCVKVKIRGDDLDWDVERMARAYEVLAANRGRLDSQRLVLTCDANEQAPSIEHAVEMLERLRRRSPAAYAALLFVEQPTSRDLEQSMDMRPLARLKPVVADECLTDLASLQRAFDLGWTGAALKCCKGQSEALLMIACCQQRGVPYTLMDLTAPDIALAQAIGLAARARLMARMVESNSRQFLPQANERLAQRMPDVFRLVAGKVNTAALAGPGLGY